MTLLLRLKLGLAAGLFAACTTAAAMTVEVHGNLIFATGTVDDDLRLFEEAVAKPGVDTVVFVNSPGGNLWNGLRVGRLIASRGLKTVIAGRCLSACSIMFIGGRERRFSDALRPTQTHIGIHGAHDPQTKQIALAQQAAMYAFYKLHIGDKFNASIMNKALFDMVDAGAMLVVRDPVRSPKIEPFHCRSGQTPREQCTRFPGETATSLGLTTHDDLVKLTLPPTMRPVDTVFGRALPPEVDELTAPLEAIAQRQCVAETCKQAVARYPGRADHRALVSALSGPGIGWSMGADTPMQALVRAVSACNHPASGAGRFCEAEFINGHPLRPLYRQSDEAHKAALASLKPPAEAFYANEEFGGAFASSAGFRTEKLNDITPLRLDGIQTVGTQALARLLTNPMAPVALDTEGHFDTIPSAVGLSGSGFAFAAQARDQAYHARFERMLRAVAPDTAAPVVFFGSGRNGWGPVNAALRAKQLGYTQVLWYRGGMEAWNAAGLPTALGVVRAVVQ